MAPTYTENDIQIVGDAVSYIRTHSDRFFNGDATGPRLASHLVECLILLDTGSVRIERYGTWYSISAEKDWLAFGNDGVSFEVFHRFIPMPSGGLLFDRGEVFLTALADAVVTSGSDGTNWVSGDGAVWKLPGELALLLPPKRGRIIAFHHSKFSAVQSA
ncbi:hypothetical protein JQ597_02490 [Bradyrhizobium sp. AUGA SZCCT0177]|uniref:hypothetical protein n=1 Tax=unclassified Bradyrhizobium TaxID=2631580 RepID=UPI001BA44851|nr:MULTISPECIES: hypothetical protein [unclassified Bradyrhizobium]MBR1235832.1 hypothetical protein [Bradyrhizobium sp. AUGA SZCCT0182]MBR1280901.1 hypothetical protein [Bradyrhizobium sp. AUGA SZCCT0177]